MSLTTFWLSWDELIPKFRSINRKCTITNARVVALHFETKKQVDFESTETKHFDFSGSENEVELMHFMPVSIFYSKLKIVYTKLQ